MSRIKTNKYRVSPASERRWNGRTFDSKAEMLYARKLAFLRSAGEIIEYIEQPRVTLGVPENEYKPDFFVVPTDAKQAPHYVDVKGAETRQFKKVKKLWATYGHLDLHVVKREGQRFKVVEVIEGNG